MSGSKNTKKTPSSQPGPIDRDKAGDTASADESAIKASVLPSDQSAALADQVDTNTSETVHPKESMNAEKPNDIKAPSSGSGQSVPQQAQRSQIFGLFGFMFAGLLVALASFGGAQYSSGNWPFERIATDFEARLATQSDEISALNALIASYDDTTALQDLQAQIDGMRTIVTDLAALQVEIEQLFGVQDETIDRVAALEEKLTSQSGINPAANAEITRYATALKLVQTQISEQNNAIAEQRAGIAELSAAVELTHQETKSATHQSLTDGTISQVIGALESGAPFAFAIAGLQDFDNLLTPALVAAAPYGVPTADALARAFPEQSRTALIAARTTSTSQASGSNRVGDFLRSQLGMRSITPRAGNDPDAVLSRAEAAIQAGQVSNALSALTALPDSARTSMAGWIEQAELRQAAQLAVAALSQQLQKD
ncbi:MAG: hypothetical protein HOL77_02245 [Rhodobacteraceae bacterium]|nr:hypothetical protein [Paracoccaceae bacterium]